MKKLLLLSLLCCISFGSVAQNYNCFTPGIRQYFVNSDTSYAYAGGYMRGMYIDSIRVVGNTTNYYPFHSVRGTYGFQLPGLDTTGGSWLGKKVVQLQDGTFLFDNYWGDTVVIKTQANVGDTWMLYDDTTHWYYTATMTAKNTMTVLGVIDSVKTIRVTAYKNGLPNVADPVNNLEIMISKNHGFAQVCDLYMFPMHKPDSAYTASYNGFDYYTDVSTNKSPYLLNLTFKLIQFYNPSNSDVNNFNVGDVFESVTEGNNLPHTYNLDTITYKWYYPDRIDYHVRKWTYYDHISISGRIFDSLNFIDDDFSVNNDLVFDTTFMPENFGYRGVLNRVKVAGFGLLYHYWPGDTLLCYTSNSYGLAYDFISNIGNEYQVNTFEPCGVDEIFKLGFGNTPTIGILQYDSCGDPGGSSSIIEQLQYMHKANGVSCGTFTPLAVQNIKNILKDVSVYPNPAKGQLTIKLPPGTFGVAVINSIGQTLYSNPNSKGQEVLNTLNIPSGIYMVLVTDTEGDMSNYKVVVQH